MNRIHHADFGAHRQMGSAAPLQSEARGPMTQPGELDDALEQHLADITQADMERAFWRGCFCGVCVAGAVALLSLTLHAWAVLP